MCRRVEQSKPILSQERSDEALSSFPFDDDEEKMNFSTFYYFFFCELGAHGRLTVQNESEAGHTNFDSLFS